jgi:hypothetical protein
MRLAAVDRLHGGQHRRAGVLESGQLPAVADVVGRERFGMPPQDGLDELLRDPMRQLGRGPRSVELPYPLDRLRRGGQAQARQLVSRVAREVGDVGRMVGRQTLGAHLLCESVATEMLHRPRLRGVGLRIERRA